MIDENTAIIIASIVSAPFLAQLVMKIFDRHKTGAEVHNLNVTGEISVIGTYKTLITDLKSEMEEMKAEMKAMKVQFALIVESKDSEILMIKEKNRALEERVDVLETELAKYKGVKIKEIVHNAVDVATAQIKQDLK